MHIFAYFNVTGFMNTYCLVSSSFSPFWRGWRSAPMRHFWLLRRFGSNVTSEWRSREKHKYGGMNDRLHSGNLQSKQLTRLGGQERHKNDRPWQQNTYCISPSRAVFQCDLHFSTFSETTKSVFWFAAHLDIESLHNVERGNVRRCMPKSRVRRDLH